MDRRF